MLTQIFVRCGRIVFCECAECPARLALETRPALQVQVCISAKSSPGSLGVFKFISPNSPSARSRFRRSSASERRVGWKFAFDASIAFFTMAFGGAAALPVSMQQNVQNYQILVSCPLMH